MQISITVKENGLIFLDYKWNLSKPIWAAFSETPGDPVS